MDKIKLFISIFRPGRGMVDCIEGNFTAVEHFNGDPINTGKLYARNKFLDEKSVVHVSAEHNETAERKLSEYLDVPKTHLIAKVHNPHLACFKSYEYVQLGEITVCYYQVSAGYCYAVVRKEWASNNINFGSVKIRQAG